MWSSPATSIYYAETASAGWDRGGISAIPPAYRTLGPARTSRFLPGPRELICEKLIAMRGKIANRYKNLVLRLDLLLQVCNPLLVSGMVGRPFLLEGSSPVLEEFLLPAVEDRRLESHFIAQPRDGLLLQQMPPQNGDLL